MASDNKKISDFDNLASGSIQDTDQVEVGRPSTKNFKFTWANLKAALKTYFDTLYATLTNFNSHKARHQNGGADEVSIAGLDGESTELATHKAVETVGVHGSTVAATANKLAHRDANGRTKVANGAVSGDVVNKGQLDLKEDVANKKTDLTDNSDVYYPSQQAVKEAVDAKADDADVIKKDGSVAFTGDASMSGNKLRELGAPIDDNDAARKVDVVGDISYSPGTQVLAEALTAGNTTSGTYTKKKEIRIGKGGTITISFSMYADITGGNVAYGRIYKNGVAHGTEWSNPTQSWAAYTEDLVFEAGDLVQLYFKAGDGVHLCYYANFELLVSNSPLVVVNLDI